ncbi:MAG: cytochrome c peroxidase [Aquificota bacterium]|nr:cytochrome c peroxidase [Aquificota bacterium]
MWRAVMNEAPLNSRLQELFRKAYGEREYTIADYANAVAQFQKVAFSTPDSPWDRYLKGEKDALSYEAKLPVPSCSSEKLSVTPAIAGACLRTRNFHNIGVPQMGPGKDSSGLDYGRFLVTGKDEDKV